MLHRRRNKHTPSTFLIPFHISLLLQIGQHLLQCGAIDPDLLLQIGKCRAILRLKRTQNLTVCLCTENYPLTVIPPHLAVSLGHKQNIILDFFCYQTVYVFMEWSDIL